MVSANRLLQNLLSIGLTLGCAAAFAGNLQSPDAVKQGLYKLASEYGDMDRKLATERFDRLPHENQEFRDESRLLRTAIADEPGTVKKSHPASTP